VFDAQLQVLDAEILDVSDHLELAFTLGILIPVGPGKAMPAPAGRVRVPLTKESALDLASSLVTAAESLPDAPPPSKASDLIIAGNMSQVESVAAQANAFRGTN
jgi:hypothetical protein